MLQTGICAVIPWAQPLHTGKGRYVRPRNIKGFSRTPGSWYRYEGGRFHSGLMALNIALTDANPGDGGFCCIPGSHKGGLLPPLGEPSNGHAQGSHHAVG